MKVIIGFLVWDRDRAMIKIRVRVGVSFNVVIYHRSKCTFEMECDERKIWGLRVDDQDILQKPTSHHGHFCFHQDVADSVHSLQSVVNEIKDKATRQRLAVLPYELKLREPSTECIQIGNSDINELFLRYLSLPCVLLVFKEQIIT